VPRKLDRSPDRPAVVPVVDRPIDRPARARALDQSARRSVVGRPADGPLHPPVPPILALVQEELPVGPDALHLRVSLRSPGGCVVESRAVIASPDAVGAALAALAVGWAVALDPAFADHPVVIVRP